MKKIQEAKKVNPLPIVVNFSIFDKSKNKNNFVSKISSGPQKSAVVNSPQFRINQHKGA